MLGFEDGWVALAFVLCIASSALCVIYGLLNWNKGEEPVVSPEDTSWAKEEQKVEDEL